MAKGGRMCRFGQRKASVIGRVLDERGSGPKKIVGTASAISEAKGVGMDCDDGRPSAEAFHNQDSLESRMLGNWHVRFGVGAGVKLPRPHHAV